MKVVYSIFTLLVLSGCTSPRVNAYLPLMDKDDKIYPKRDAVVFRATKGYFYPIEEEQMVKDELIKLRGKSNAYHNIIMNYNEQLDKKKLDTTWFPW